MTLPEDTYPELSSPAKPATEADVTDPHLVLIDAGGDELSYRRASPTTSVPVSRWQEITEALRDAQMRAAEAGWDGYESAPLSTRSLEEGERLLSFLPSDISLPDVLVTPDGEILLEWYEDRDNILNVIVSSEGSVHYSAGVDGNTHRGAFESFIHFPSILEIIARRLSAPESAATG